MKSIKKISNLEILSIKASGELEEKVAPSLISSSNSQANLWARLKNEFEILVQ
jgi:hypothetical protein